MDNPTDGPLYQMIPGMVAWKTMDGIAGMLMAGSKEGSVGDDV